MAELKTKKTRASVKKFVDAIADEATRDDCRRLVDIMQKITGEPPAMWGDAMVGFGKYKYRYASGREGEWFVTGFSPRKQNLTLYVMCELEKQTELMEKLGPHKCGKSCLYIKRLDDLHLPALKKLIRHTVNVCRSQSVD